MVTVGVPSSVIRGVTPSALGVSCVFFPCGLENLRLVAGRAAPCAVPLLLQGWYIVTYALGIYHLNLFIAFLSPKVDPSLMEDSDDGPSLPTRQNEEFRPFIRRLPEFKFWHAATKGILVAMVCTFFEAFNVPVFWPILVMYFIMLFCITMKRQIKHMIKYRYIPFTHGKRRYKGKEDVGKTFAS